MPLVAARPVIDYRWFARLLSWKQRRTYGRVLDSIQHSCAIPGVLQDAAGSAALRSSVRNESDHSWNIVGDGRKWQAPRLLNLRVFQAGFRDAAVIRHPKPLQPVHWTIL